MPELVRVRVRELELEGELGLELGRELVLVWVLVRVLVMLLSWDLSLILVFLSPRETPHSDIRSMYTCCSLDQLILGRFSLFDPQNT